MFLKGHRAPHGSKEKQHLINFPVRGNLSSGEAKL